MVRLEIQLIVLCVFFLFNIIIILDEIGEILNKKITDALVYSSGELNGGRKNEKKKQTRRT